jgi:Cu/Ag efflux pump CusA
VFYLYGYTLNRITLFALIFSIGILVDDAIVVVENIVRHMRLPVADANACSRSPSRPLTKSATPPSSPRGPSSPPFCRWPS